MIWTALVIVGCKSDPPPVPLIDTGWFEDLPTEAERCPDRVETTTPDQGVVDWYWRDLPRIFTTSREDTAYEVFLIDRDGFLVEVSRIWDPEFNRFDLQPAGPLRPDMAYTLRVVDCEGTRDVAFTTSDLGLPLVDGPAMVAGRTYELNLQQATWLEPGGVAPLLTLYFDTPVLIGVPLANSENLHLNLALAYEDDDGVLHQYLDEPPIGFPVVAFTDQPFFAASTAQVDLDFSGVTIPVYDFEFSGTFTTSGESIGGGAVRGIGDSRYAGSLLGNDAPGEVCDVAAGLGVLCLPCPTDNEPYCLPVSITDVRGTWIPGLTVQAL